MKLYMKHIKRWLPLTVIILLITGAWTFGLMDLISLETVKQQREELLIYVSQHPILSALTFILIYTATVALSLPIATIMTLLGGFLFGRWLGTLLIVISATLGATIIFSIARSALGDTLRKKAGPLYDKAAKNMKDNAIGYMLFMRLMPLFPFVLVNILPALFNVRLLPYVLTTFLGIIPGTFVYANLGRELGTIETLSDLVSFETLLAFTLLGTFALIPTLYKQIKNRKAIATIALITFLSFPTQGHASQNYDKFLSLYDQLLTNHTAQTTDGNIDYIGVNYERWGQDTNHKKARKLLEQETPETYEGDTKKAFWINAYNFLTINLIIREKEQNSIKNLGSFFTSVWKKHQWKIGGKNYTLHEIEHDILRPMGDARIHFAINCASISCPDLRTESYRSAALNNQLNEQVKTAISNTGKGISIKNDTIYISNIFGWFDEDFKNGNIKSWLNDYIPLPQNATIRYLDYNWSLNKVETKGNR